MIKPVGHKIKRAVRNLPIVLLSFTFSHAINAAEETGNNEPRLLYESVCTQCHGLQMIEKTRDGRRGWEDTVHKMVVAGAQLSVVEMESVIDYLFQHYGPGSGNPMKTGALPPDSPLQADGTITGENITLPEGEGLQLVQGYCHRCHDLGRVVASRRSADAWRSYTKNMIAQGDIELSAEEIEMIAVYLIRNFGKSGDNNK